MAEEEARWDNFAGHAAHTGQAIAPLQAMRRVRWTLPIDEAPQYVGNRLQAHYASPLVTPGNIVVDIVKTGPDGHFRMEARDGYTGYSSWKHDLGYVPPPQLLTPACAPALVFFEEGGGGEEGEDGAVAAPDAGGTVTLKLETGDAKSGYLTLCFYGVDEYYAHQEVYDQNVRICTPLTSDDVGNIYFGFVVLGETPNGLQSGLAVIHPDGSGAYVPASVASGDPGTVRPVYNGAPALNEDQTLVYFAVTGSQPYLVGVSTADLSPVCHGPLQDPTTGLPAPMGDDLTTSPTVGPDGDVYFGVGEGTFGANHGRGFLLHFSPELAPKGYPGEFGIDTTASVVSAAAVPSYSGASAYLLVMRCSDPLIGGGQGQHRLVVLDPNDFQFDVVSGSNVMREVLSVLSPTPDGHGGRTEWLANTIVVDEAGRRAVANNADGACYVWNLASGSLEASLSVGDGTGEAMTPVAMGPDGTVYVISNGVLCAVSDNTVLPLAYWMERGVADYGHLNALYYDDDEDVAVRQGGGFTPPQWPVQMIVPTQCFMPLGPEGSFLITVASRASQEGIAQRIELWNYAKGAYDSVDQRMLGQSSSRSTVKIGQDAADYIDPATLEMQVRLSYRPVKPMSRFVWNAYVNLVAWDIEP